MYVLVMVVLIWTCTGITVVRGNRYLAELAFLAVCIKLVEYLLPCTVNGQGSKTTKTTLCL